MVKNDLIFYRFFYNGCVDEFRRVEKDLKPVQKFKATCYNLHLFSFYEI